MVDIKPVKKVTVTEQIMDQIAGFVRSGELQPGQKLPTERDLAVKFGVTRGRVREALRALSLIGLIVIKPGEGSFVSGEQEPISSETIVWMFHNEIHNLEEVYAARRLIETEVYAAAVRSDALTDLEPLEQTLSELRRLAPLGQAVPFLDQLDRFDLYVGEHCGNRIYAKLMQTIVHLRRETSLKILSVPGSIELSVKSRAHIYEALRHRDPAAAEQAIGQFFAASSTFYHEIGME